VTQQRKTLVRGKPYRMVYGSTKLPAYTRKRRGEKGPLSMKEERFSGERGRKILLSKGGLSISWGARTGKRRKMRTRFDR